MSFWCEAGFSGRQVVFYPGALGPLTIEEIHGAGATLADISTVCLCATWPWVRLLFQSSAYQLSAQTYFCSRSSLCSDLFCFKLTFSADLVCRGPNRRLFKSQSWLPWPAPCQGPSRQSSLLLSACKKPPASIACLPAQTRLPRSLQSVSRSHEVCRLRTASKRWAQRFRSMTHSLEECKIAWKIINSLLDLLKSLCP